MGEAISLGVCCLRARPTVLMSLILGFKSSRGQVCWFGQRPGSIDLCTIRSVVNGNAELEKFR